MQWEYFLIYQELVEKINKKRGIIYESYFACAGTGGHINPAIAIAGIILKNKPDTEVLFIGTKTGLENELVKKSGFEIKHIRTGKLIRSLTFKNIKAVTETYKGISDSVK